MEKEASPSIASRGLGRWFGRSALIALGVFLTGRLAVEPLRTVPHFDAKGMDPYSAVEHFRLKQRPEPFSVALFGSSVSIWGILPEIVADELKLPHERVRKLAVVGGTPFDHWKLIERSPEKFNELRVALIELNPRMMHPDMESDQRVRFTISQHASWRERKQLWHNHERNYQRMEVVLPLISVRRSLRTVVFNVAQPVHGSPIHTKPDWRLYPFLGWHVPEGTIPTFRDLIPPQTAARRLVSGWRCSRLQDQCLRRTLAFMEEKGVKVILYQLPVHPDVAEHIRTTPQYSAANEKFRAYVETLNIPLEDRIQITDIADCGAPVEAMRDLTHFNELGAKIYSRWLGTRLRTMLGDMNLQDSMID